MLVKLLTDKPTVKTKIMDHKDIYSMASIIQYFNDNGMSNQNATDALHTIQNSRELKSKLKHVKVKDLKNKTSNPYYYMDLTDAKAESIKNKIEEKFKKEAEPELAKRAEMRKKSAASAKEKAATRKTKTTKK
jgi:Asp-tRNA(Asn)/Glu-tRNA(Gln) amidotransferase A subunit family amidase